MASQAWTPSSWRSKPIKQHVTYPDFGEENLNQVREKIQRLPGLVTPQEIIRLKEQLKRVGRGEAFLLHGGDCAELFDYCNHEHISSRVKLLLMMSLIIIWGTRTPVVRVGRIAGQFAKPRSQPTEMIDGKEYMSFRGDIVNGHSLEERKPDPNRLLLAYFHSAAISNHIRALLTSGFADLQKPSAWPFAHVRSPILQAKYQDIVERLEDSMDFMKTIGAAHQHSDGTMGTLDTVDIWTSHEALLLEYEEALTRRKAPLQKVRARGIEGSSTEASISETLSASSDPFFSLSAHLIWVGDRTRQLDHAHLEYLRGISNPIGIKLGPTTDPAELIKVLDLVNPEFEEGKIVLICRFGVDKVEKFLPVCIKAVMESSHRHSIFCCDPMHGNTKTAEGMPGIKTRYMNDMLSEISQSIKIHHELGSKLRGIHLEMTGELDKEGYSVTECLGGSMELETSHLSLNYQSYCDPRLNYEQSLDVAFLIAEQYKNLRNAPSASNKQ
ncbi:phospho-2-dehydro-3-deoxyheptonate aldolase [Phakopsora pachyrhizi]|uniref:Phospho-2-dehydro-3-deoxyheptonate aldolase n=1 Tax=Phakopsora pachyrhizi TaxID=170000 RepID=A0AAV0BMD7_PHAPC|nr:phospho-2-dehydro-3-deoxyheptonate aldolase [Phakopsora pachyrhizi]CAH7687117.1 phospho-2-dehydro-3-deoxyheptonate aldolase [Phakopsora pachyrhizi]